MTDIETIRLAFEKWCETSSLGHANIHDQELDYTFPEHRQAWIVWQAGWDEALQIRCYDCHGSGQVCVGSSGQDSDGNAPILERCDTCGGFGIVPLNRDMVDWQSEFERMSLQFQRETLRASKLQQELTAIRERTGDITGIAGPLSETGWD